MAAACPFSPGKAHFFAVLAWIFLKLAGKSSVERRFQRHHSSRLPRVLFTRPIHYMVYGNALPLPCHTIGPPPATLFSRRLQTGCNCKDWLNFHGKWPFLLTLHYV